MKQAALTFAKTSHLAARWNVDRTSVPAILTAHGVARSPFHDAPHYSWSEVLSKVEGIPRHCIENDEVVKTLIAEGLLTTAQVADVLAVSAQTVRNYVASGRLQAIRLTSHTPRFHPYQFCENGNEVKTEAYAES